MSFKRYFITIISFVILGAAAIANPRYHCDNDSALALRLISEASKAESFADRIVLAAKALEGVPYAPAADNDSLATIVIRLDSLSQREFINVVIAAAKTAELTRPSLREFERNLENVARHKGKDEGFPSQFLYGADWIVDNVYRGNLKEKTEDLEGSSFRTKTLDHVSRHPEKFPAMSNPDVAEKVRINEFGYRSHKIPHMKKQAINNKNMVSLLQNGDIILLCPLEDDFDIYDIGFVSIENGNPTLIHISKDSNTVSLDQYPLSRLFKIQGQFFYGFRWLRPVE